LRRWFSISGVDPMALTEHFLQFGQLGVSFDELVDKVKATFFLVAEGETCNFCF